ncbi:MAG: SDR family oxidoreductase [Syntrophobacteraceae bacterium]|jgi:dTDP-4-dehydrorhamnose reductase
MRILILGGDGMLGHQLLTGLRSRHEVKVTLRRDISAYSHYGLFNRENTYDGIDVRSLERLLEVMADFRPQAVINAVGIVKQRPTAKDSISSLEINALLPHRLAVLCKGICARLVHLSTDCIFSGKEGHYQESDPSDAEDLYGKTKFLGETQDNHCLTLRTSIIGRELSRKKSLLEWFLSQTGMVKGFTKAIYTGFTTLEMTRIIENMLVHHPAASGVYQVSSDPINKYELLLLFREKLDLKIEIVPDDSFCCDRSLDSTRFRQEFAYTPPTWEAMIEELRV